MYKKYTNTNNSVDIHVNKKPAYVDVTVPTAHNPQIDITYNQNSDKFFKFTQAVASDTWEISHNLAKYPSVSIVDSGDNVVVGEVKYIDENNLVVTFTGAFAGYAYLN